MAALARAYGVDCVPHQTQPAVGHTASLHFVAALAHAHHPCEYNDYSGTQDGVFTRPIRPVDGKFTLSDASGLGLDLVEDELHKRMVPWSVSAGR
jgi:L-alanine-DL-glutamate epimerase-like enolase superfamily enzyme